MNGKILFTMVLVVAAAATLTNYFYDWWLHQLIIWGHNVDPGYSPAAKGLILVFGLLFPGLVLSIAFLLLGERKGG